MKRFQALGYEEVDLATEAGGRLLHIGTEEDFYCAK
jgi:hypothetical protein